MATKRMRFWMRRFLLLLAVIPLPALGGESARMRLQPGTAKPGDVVLVTVRGLDTTPTGAVGEHALRFSPIPGGYQALTGLPVESADGELAVKIWSESAPAEPKFAGILEVGPPQFPERELQVANKFVQPPAKVRKWMAEDRAAFSQAFAQAHSPRRFSEAFSWPVTPVVTAHFGDLRTYNGKKQSQHYGLDLNGAVGDPVYAANDGTVVLSRSCYASGDTVIIHHGMGLYTAYFHLSKRLVQVGTAVKRGQLVGKVGATGRVTGPHLHFGVKVDGRWVNPESLMGLDFE